MFHRETNGAIQELINFYQQSQQLLVKDIERNSEWNFTIDPCHDWEKSKNCWVRSLCLMFLSELNPTKFKGMWCIHVWIYMSKLCSFEANWKFSTCSSQEVAYWMVYIITSWKKKSNFEPFWRDYLTASSYMSTNLHESSKPHEACKIKTQDAKLTSYIIFKISHAKTEVKSKGKVF